MTDERLFEIGKYIDRLKDLNRIGGITFTTKDYIIFELFEELVKERDKNNE